MTGLTKDGQAVASSSYNLYGSTKDSTDETGNPYAYNGEARDGTGLDYLRARYYDSQAGTFLTEDSYQGELDDPLSQNRYSYVHNNPVNYTDPSGHFRKMLPDGQGPRYTQPKPLINPKDGTLYAPTTPEHEAHQIRQQQTGVYSYTYIPSHVPTSSAYEYIQQQESQLRAQAHAQAVQYRQQQIRQEYAQSIGQYGRPRAREANNLLLNWSKALKDMFTHVCDPKTTKAKDKGKSPKPISFGGGGVASWEGTGGPSSRYQPNVPVPSNRMSKEEVAAARKEGGKLLKVIGGELSGWYNAKRLWTGKDPVTGEKADRWWAVGELAFDVASYAVALAKLGKVAKVGVTAGKVIDTVDDVSDTSKALKAVDTVDDTKDSLKVAEAVDDVGDAVKGIPKEVDDVVDYARTHNGAAQDGYKGNRVYNNMPRNSGDQKLPDGPVYREYDIYPNVKGKTRGTERVIIGDDGSVWYTDNHYKSFTRVR